MPKGPLSTLLDLNAALAALAPLAASPDPSLRYPAAHLIRTIRDRLLKLDPAPRPGDDQALPIPQKPQHSPAK